jgi:hypothetical protein
MKRSMPRTRSGFKSELVGHITDDLTSRSRPLRSRTASSAIGTTSALAWLALVAVDPSTADHLERQSLTVDPRQPRARAVLALAVAEIDGRTWDAALIDRSFVAA